MMRYGIFSMRWVTASRGSVSGSRDSFVMSHHSCVFYSSQPLLDKAAYILLATLFSTLCWFDCGMVTLWWVDHQLNSACDRFRLMHWPTGISAHIGLLAANAWWVDGRDSMADASHWWWCDRSTLIWKTNCMQYSVVTPQTHHWICCLFNVVSLL